MRHQVHGRKFGRSSSHRWALFRNLVSSLVEHEKIETTLNKAKDLRRFADHLITLGKKESLSAKRQVLKYVRSSEIMSKVFSELAPRFKDRQGGYTRIYKLGYRLGDSAPMALIEYLPGSPADKAVAEKSEKGAKKAAAKKKDAKKEKVTKSAEPAKETKAKSKKSLLSRKSKSAQSSKSSKTSESKKKK